MPAADALTVHTAIREQCNTEDFRNYVNLIVQELAERNDNNSSWMETMDAKAMRNALEAAETYYISPDMHEVVKLACEDFPREEAVLRDDPPSDVGLLFMPSPFRPSSTATLPDAAPMHAFLWRGECIWMFGDMLDPNDPQRETVMEAGADPAAWMRVAGRYTLAGLTKFNFGKPIPTQVTFETVELDGLNLPFPKEQQTESVSYLLAVWRLMQQTLSSVIREESEIPRPVRRRAERSHLKKGVTVIDLRRSESSHGHGTGRQMNVRYLRRGHWRRVWCGPMDGERYQRSVYIHPTVCGPAGAPLIVRGHVNALTR